MPKPNPILAAFERKKEEEFMNRLQRNSEMNMIAMLLSGNNLGFVAEKRAGALLDEFIEVKMKLARGLVADSEDDPSLTYTKVDIHRRLVQILGEDEWKRGCRNCSRCLTNTGRCNNYETLGKQIRMCRPHGLQRRKEDHRGRADCC